MKTFRTYFNGLSETGTPDNPSELTCMVRAHAEGINALAAALPALQTPGKSDSLSSNQKNALHDIVRLKTHLTPDQQADLHAVMRGVIELESTGNHLTAAVEKLLNDEGT